jgi:hypothetical protein
MDSIAHRVRELIIVVGIRFLVDTFSAFKLYVEGLTQDGSQLVGSVVGPAPGSVVARAGIMSTGCSLKGIVVGFHNQSRQLPAGHRH